jgi:hypothetical protein
MKNLTLDNQSVDQAMQPARSSSTAKILTQRIIGVAVLLTCVASLMVRPDLWILYLAGAAVLAIVYVASVVYDVMQMDFDMKGIDISMTEIIDDLGR